MTRTVTTLLALVLFSNFANADLINLRIEGTVTSVDSHLIGSFSTGELVVIETLINTDEGVGTGVVEQNDQTEVPNVIENGAYQNTLQIGESFTTSNFESPHIFIEDSVITPESRPVFLQNANNYASAPVFNDYHLINSIILLEFANDNYVIEELSERISSNEILSLNFQQFSELQDSRFEFINYATNDVDSVIFTVNSISATQTQPALPTKYFHVERISDINGNGLAELAFLRTVSSGNVHVLIRDAITRDYIKTMMVFNASFEPLGMTLVPDGNGNGYDELAIMALEHITNKTRTVVIDTFTEEQLSVFTF